MNRRHTCLFFQIGRSCGGAERRLIRIFGRIYPNEEKGNVTILIKDNGMPSSVKNDIGKWSCGREEYVGSMAQAVLFLLTRRYHWVCASSLGYTTPLILFVAALSGAKRLFASVHHRSSLLLFENGKISNRFYASIRMSNCVDCLYPNAVKGLQERFPGKSVTLTPGAFTDIEEFVPKEKRNVIVFAATLIEGKGLKLFIEALQMLKDELINGAFSAIVCGDGPLLHGAEEWIRTHELSNIVQMLGRVNMSTILPHAAIFCSLQSPTNYPSQSLIEAMACGCYCIVTDTGESKLMITQEFGNLIKSTPDALVDAIRRAMKHSEQECEAIASAARRYVATYFTLERSLEHYEQLFM